jgi:hypothetical protein
MITYETWAVHIPMVGLLDRLSKKVSLNAVIKLGKHFFYYLLMTDE